MFARRREAQRKIAMKILPSAVAKYILAALLVGACAVAQAMPGQRMAETPPRYAVPPTGPVNQNVWVQLQSGTRIPLFSEKHASTPVARVGTEIITLRELTEALAAMHDGAGQEQTGAKDFRAVLERLIKVRLVLLEARQMGLEDLPQVRGQIESRRPTLMREIIREKATADVAPDAAEVEKLYRLAIREWKIKSVLFEKEEEAKTMVEQLHQGREYDELASRLVAEKKAVGGEKSEYAGGGQMLPEVAATAATMEVGAFSPVVRVSTGFAVFRVEDVRHVDNPAAKDFAEQLSLSRLHAVAQQKQMDELAKRYARIDKRLLERLDFEKSVEGFQALAKDRRVLVTISGDKPIAVADLAAELQKSFYHGVERAVKGKKVNEQKDGAFKSLLHRRLLDRQAAAEKIERTETFKARMEAHRRAVLFDLFVAKVIRPDVKVTDEDIRNHYERNRAEFTDPEFYRLQSLGFVTAQHARAALGKLKAGTDFRWMGANAEGLAPEHLRTLGSDGSTVTASSLPAALGKGLSGTRAGDYRQYSSPEGVHYVVRVAEHVPPKQRKLEEVRDRISKKLFSERLARAFDDWTSKLRKPYQTEIYITGIGS
jgi:hypothetical protein